MTAETRRDVLVGLFRELYRVAPSGRSSLGLHRLLSAQITCETGDVDQMLNLGRDRGWFGVLPQDDFSPSLEPYWIITADGKREAAIRRIV